MAKIERKETSRGFGYCLFDDCYGVKCSLQESSLALENAIWFGIDKIEEEVMSYDKGSDGLHDVSTRKTLRETLPKKEFVGGRMHLTQDQVKELLPFLEKFAKTGRL